MKKTIKGISYLMNLQGEAVPVSIIPPEDVERDELVEKIFSKIEKMKAIQKRLAASIDNDLRAFLEKKAKKWGAFQLSNYTGDKKIQYDFSEMTSFTEDVELAKEKIYDCLKKWKGENEGSMYLEALVKTAFGGKQLNKTSLMKLLSFYVQDKDWIEAQTLIQKSLRVINKKRRRTFYKRKNKDSKFQMVNLNFTTYGEGDDD
ncbi:MAG: DUF3164 family protein [Spirochaetales bacterium]|nr:DUF3164 family protein [Spirochaetales bacterium]